MSQPSSRRRWLFLGAIVAILLVAPALTLLPDGGSSAPSRVAAEAADRPELDVPQPSAGGTRPLPRPRPQVVEPEAGLPADEAADAGEGVETEVPAGGGTDAGGRIAPGAPTDEELRADLDALERANRRVRRLLASGQYPIEYGTGRLIWPLPGHRTVSSPFGPRWGRLHAGIDVPAPTGTRIVAADRGTVVLSGPTGGYGNYVCIQHTRSLTTCYAHLSRIMARAGQDVRAGEVIGLVGSTGNSTGPHLHFETRNGGSPFNPMRFF